VILDDTHFQLRAERMGGGDGRVYTITYTATDDSGNSTTEIAEVRVPHNRTGSAYAYSGFLQDGTGFQRGTETFALVIPSTPQVTEIGPDGTPIVIQDSFDATQLEANRVYVGNTAGFARPVRGITGDVDQSGLNDLVVYYPVEAVQALLEQNFVSPGVEGDDTYHLNTHGPICLHYETSDSDYLVYDIFNLGAPLSQHGGAIGSNEDGLPDESALQQTEQAVPEVTGVTAAYPNPFNPATTILLSLKTDANVVLNVYNFRGVLVRQLRNETMAAGFHEVVWDGTDNDGLPVAAGVYLADMVAGDIHSVLKLALIK
jgi:hypothetical protein